MRVGLPDLGSRRARFEIWMGASILMMPPWGCLAEGLVALGYHVDTFNSGSVLAYLYREHAALLAAVVACEDVNDIALLIFCFPHLWFTSVS